VVTLLLLRSKIGEPRELVYLLPCCKVRVSAVFSGEGGFSLVIGSIDPISLMATLTSCTTTNRRGLEQADGHIDQQNDRIYPVWHQLE
jgi:predicted metal-binding protein